MILADSPELPPHVLQNGRVLHAAQFELPLAQTSVILALHFTTKHPARKRTHLPKRNAPCLQIARRA
jgi:hypothetical protein